MLPPKTQSWMFLTPPSTIKPKVSIYNNLLLTDASKALIYLVTSMKNDRSLLKTPDRALKSRNKKLVLKQRMVGWRKTLTQEGSQETNLVETLCPQPSSFRKPTRQTRRHPETKEAIACRQSHRRSQRQSALTSVVRIPQMLWTTFREITATQKWSARWRPNVLSTWQTQLCYIGTRKLSKTWMWSLKRSSRSRPPSWWPPKLCLSSMSAEHPKLDMSSPRELSITKISTTAFSNRKHLVNIFRKNHCRIMGKIWLYSNVEVIRRTKIAAKVSKIFRMGLIASTKTWAMTRVMEKLSLLWLFQTRFWGKMRHPLRMVGSRFLQKQLPHVQVKTCLFFPTTQCSSEIQRYSETTQPPQYQPTSRYRPRMEVWTLCLLFRGIWWFLHPWTTHMGTAATFLARRRRRWMLSARKDRFFRIQMRRLLISTYPRPRKVSME